MLLKIVNMQLYKDCRERIPSTIILWNVIIHRSTCVPYGLPSLVIKGKVSVTGNLYNIDLFKATPNSRLPLKCNNIKVHKCNRPDMASKLRYSYMRYKQGNTICWQSHCVIRCVRKIGFISINCLIIIGRSKWKKS